MGFRDWLFGTKKQELKEAVSYGYLPGVPASGTLDFWNYRPDQDGFLPVGFYRKRSKLGDNPQAFLDGEQLRMSRETSRNLCVLNEYARNGLTNRRNYIVGTGFKTIAEPRDGSTVNEKLIKQVNDFLLEFAAVNKRAEKEKEAVFRGDRDGEVFLRLFFDDGVLKFRFVEPEYVGDWDGQTPFGIKTDPKDITNVLSYLIRYDDSSEYETVSANEIIHVKLNSDSGIKRGLPFLYPVFGILRKIESTNENMATNVAIMSAIAMIRKNPFKSRSAVDSNNSSNADYTAPRMPGGGVNNYRNYPPGSILDTDGMTEYEFPANNINLGGVVAVKESLLQTAASGMGLPEYMLTSDCSNGNLSTTQVGESPMILGMQAQQHMWGDYFGQGVYVEGAEHGLSWRAIEHAIEVGRLPQEVLLNIQLKFEGPNVVVRDRIQETQRLQILADEGIISRDSWAQKEGEVRAAVSDEDMQAKKDAETQASQNHELNMVKAKGQQPVGLKEEFEEDLHPRDDDGKFTTKGGGGDKGKGAGGGQFTGKGGTSNNKSMYYHGTKKDFDSFDDSKLGTGTSADVMSLFGHHFTDDPKKARKFATNKKTGDFGTVKHVELDIHNPYEAKESDIVQQSLKDALSDGLFKDKPSIEKNIQGILDIYKGKGDIDELHALATGYLTGGSYLDNSLPQDVVAKITTNFRNKLIAKGHDSIKYQNQIEYSRFDDMRDMVVFHGKNVRVVKTAKD